jgi:hypothetical protein
MFARLRRRSVKPEITQIDGHHYVVRFTDEDGKRHEHAFETKRQARWFAREVRKLPADQPFDREEMAYLQAEYTGSLVRDVSAMTGFMPRRRER